MQELWNILWTALGVIVTTLVTWLVGLVITWLNSKIKDKKMAQNLSTITTIIGNAVESVMQTFVSTMKKAGTWNEEAAKDALAKAKEIVKDEIAPELFKFIEDNYGDFEDYITNRIEAYLYSIKK